ncbi:hypothetical protein DL93DRAFT_2231073 [Clavulina sp. PMI_390]|nr:hypothetical protein DL93DRAFT_2231073 [Clavulina sp. PMI_390]
MEHITNTSLLGLPIDVFLHIFEIGSVDIASLIRLSWTSRDYYRSIMSNRSLWHLIALKQFRNELIFETSFPLSEMTTHQLFECATRKGRLAHLMKFPEPITCRRVDVHLAIPPEFSHAPQTGSIMDSLSAPILLRGGRYIVGMLLRSKHPIICCWDLHAALTDNGTMLPAATFTLPFVDTELLSSIVYAPRCSLQDGSFPFGLQDSTGQIHALQFHAPLLGAPHFSHVSTIHQPITFNLESVVGDWIALRQPWQLGQPPESRFWNYKKNIIVSHPSPRYVMMASGRVVAITASIHENVDITFTTLMAGSSASQLEASARPREEDLLQTPVFIHPEPGPSFTATVPRTVQGVSLDPIEPSQMDCKPVLFNAEEVLIILEGGRNSPFLINVNKRWSFSIKEPFQIACVHETGVPSTNPAGIPEWLPDLWVWSSPIQSSNNLDAQTAEARSRSLPPDVSMPNLSPTLEPRELILSPSPAPLGSWSVTAEQGRIASIVPPTIQFPARAYDETSHTPHLVGFCPRSGIWAYQLSPPVNPVPPTSSQVYVSFALVKFD